MGCQKNIIRRAYHTWIELCWEFICFICYLNKFTVVNDIKHWAFMAICKEFSWAVCCISFASVVNIWDTDTYCCVLVQWSQFSDSSLIKHLILSLEFLLKFNERDGSSECPGPLHCIFTCFGAGGCSFLMSDISVLLLLCFELLFISNI